MEVNVMRCNRGQSSGRIRHTAQNTKQDQLEPKRQPCSREMMLYAQIKRSLHETPKSKKEMEHKYENITKRLSFSLRTPETK